VEISQSRQGDHLVLRVAGRIDIQTSEAFQAALLAAVAGGTNVIVDFSDVEYISSVGFRALITATRQKPKDRHIGVASLNDLVRELFAIARFHHVIPVFASPAEAAVAWRAPPRVEQAPQPVLANETPIGVHFWGTRGSLPTPVGNVSVRAKIR